MQINKNIKIENTLDIVIRVLIYTSIIWIPLFFDIRLYSTFDLSKATSLYFIASFILLAFLCKILFTSKTTFRRTPFDLPVISYLLINILATIFSINPFMSFMGCYKRYEGLLAMFAYITIYYFTVNYLVTKKQVLLGINLILSVGFFSSIYGLIQHYGFDPLSWEFFDPYRVFATFGNPVFFSTYMLLSIPLAFIFYLIYSFRKHKNISSPLLIYGFILTVLYYTFWLTKGRATFLGLLGIILLFAILFKRILQLGLRKRQILIIFIILGILTVGFNLNPQTSVVKRILETISPKKAQAAIPHYEPKKEKKEENILDKVNTFLQKSLGTRYWIWKASLGIPVDYPLLGSGPDTLGLIYPIYLKKIFPEDAEGPIEYEDRVHNDILDNTVARGMLGLVVYFWVWIAYFIYCLRRYRYLTDEGKLLILGLAAAQIGYLIQNQFMFPMTPITHVIWVLYGLTVCVGQNFAKDKDKYKIKQINIKLPPLIRKAHINILLYIAIVAVFLVFAYFIFIKPYLADLWYKRSDTHTRWGNPEAALKEIDIAIKYNGFEPRYRDEANRLYIEKAMTAKDIKTKQEWLNKVFKNTEETLKNISQHSYAYFAKGMAFHIKGDLKEAISSYKKGIFYNPFNPDMYNNLGNALSDGGRLKEAEKAFKEALRMRPGYTSSLRQLIKLYADSNKLKKADNFIERILKRSEYNTIEVYNTLAWYYYSVKKDYKKTEECFKNILSHNQDDTQTLDNLGRLYYQLAEFDKALSVFSRIVEIEGEETERAMQAKKMIRNILLIKGVIK